MKAVRKADMLSCAVRNRDAHDAFLHGTGKARMVTVIATQWIHRDGSKPLMICRLVVI